jgi:hypothetical protein
MDRDLAIMIYSAIMGVAGRIMACRARGLASRGMKPGPEHLSGSRLRLARQSYVQAMARW